MVYAFIFNLPGVLLNDVLNKFDSDWLKIMWTGLAEATTEVNHSVAGKHKDQKLRNFILKHKY